MIENQLKLENQLCFPVYAASRLIIREYMPYLDKLDLTYPQYLVMLVLWENGSVNVNEITKKLILKTNTVTPLLKRMEKQGFITREKSTKDERKVMITLTPIGVDMRNDALQIPVQLGQKLANSALSRDEMIATKNNLCSMVDFLNTAIEKS